VKTTWSDGERQREVELDALGGNRFRVRVDGAEHEVAAEWLEDGRLRLTSDGSVTIAEVSAAGERRFVRLGSLDFVLDRRAGSARRGSSAAAAGGLEAPMPGVVTRVMVKAGESVKRGQPLVALEAMKMEHLIRAPRDGVVATIAAAPGSLVSGGVTLVELADAASPETHG
jgi:3-methylcrotonyl-CoA carboxylase alpha subunit